MGIQVRSARRHPVLCARNKALSLLRAQLNDYVLPRDCRATYLRLYPPPYQPQVSYSIHFLTASAAGWQRCQHSQIRLISRDTHWHWSNHGPWDLQGHGLLFLSYSTSIPQPYGLLIFFTSTPPLFVIVPKIGTNYYNSIGYTHVLLSMDLALKAANPNFERWWLWSGLSDLGRTLLR